LCSLSLPIQAGARHAHHHHHYAAHCSLAGKVK
jgi:hypothetical protein